MLLALGGCSPGMSAVVDSLRQVTQRGDVAATSKLDPNFAYLRVTRGRHVGLLWRGSIEKTAQGPVEVYYSGSGEVLRLRQGHLVGALGLYTEWRQVVLSPPAWSDVAAAGVSQPFVRVRDVMPGYRSGIRDELVLKVVPPPSRSELQRLDSTALTWFEQTERRTAWRLPGTADEALPPARYAVDLSGKDPTVVYSEQCLAPDFCFTWQRWSAAPARAVGVPAS